MEELAARWIPDFNGYATYLPSNSKSEKALKNINFLKGNMLGNEGTLCNLEDEKYLKAIILYINLKSCVLLAHQDNEERNSSLQHHISIFVGHQMLH